MTLTIFHKAGSKQTQVFNLPTVTNPMTLHTAPTLVATKAYKKLEVRFEFQKPIGSALIDDVSVVALP